MQTLLDPQTLSDSTMQDQINASHLCSYRKNGFLVHEGAFSPPQIQALCEETLRLCRGERGQIPRHDGGPVENTEHALDDEVLKRFLCIHFPHKISATMRHAITQDKIVQDLSGIIGPNVKCMQSMLFIKAAGKPGQAWHQDEIYIPTRDRSLTGAWIAMDDATVENGCLWVIPGSHSHGILWEQHAHNDKRFDCANETFGYPYSDSDAVPVQVKAGSVVFFNGYLLHRSLPNLATKGTRRALVNHYMSAESLLPWTTTKPTDLKPGSSVAGADDRDIIMVCGKDPYAYKGIENNHSVGIRPSGEGGCSKGKE